jgi:hypothetical protein
MVIFGPIFHVGWHKASDAIAVFIFSFGHVRKAPPEAVKMIPRKALPSFPCIH